MFPLALKIVLCKQNFVLPKSGIATQQQIVQFCDIKIIIIALPRKLTAAEKTIFLSSFPLLDVDFTIVTVEPSFNYNCISWSVDVTNIWHWPGSTLANFDSFYAQFNLVRKTKGTLAA